MCAKTLGPVFDIDRRANVVTLDPFAKYAMSVAPVLIVGSVTVS